MRGGADARPEISDRHSNIASALEIKISVFEFDGMRKIYLHVGFLVAVEVDEDGRLVVFFIDFGVKAADMVALEMPILHKLQITLIGVRQRDMIMLFPDEIHDQ